MSKRAELEARAANLATLAEKALMELASLPDIPAEPTAEPRECPMIGFTIQFAYGGRTYQYAALKADDGLWYTSGPRTPKGYKWEDLYEWISTSNSDRDFEVWQATELTQIV